MDAEPHVLTAPKGAVTFLKDSIVSSTHEIAPINIKPPFGFSELVPLLKSHRIAAAEGKVPPALKTSNAIPISISEVPRASRDYPVVFASADDGQSFGIVALTGLNNGENLFIDGQGAWRKDVYQPAYLRRYPFCMAVVSRNGETQEERIVCVERAMLDQQSGLPIEDASGEAQGWWSERLALLQEYEVDMLRTRQTCDLLDKFGLLKPFSAQAISKGGDIMTLGGMYQVDEMRIADLKADDLRMLVKKGILSRLYAHMISLDNLGRLLDLRT
jgi:hypothetical protein